MRLACPDPQIQAVRHLSGSPHFFDWDGTIMKLPILPAIVALTAALVALPAHANESAAQAQTETQEQKSAREKLAEDALKPPAVAVPEGYKPPFTQETVTKLNAIMRRSIDTLDEFDRLNDQLTNARESSDSARVAELSKRIGELEQQALAAKTDFLAEKAALIAREEYYDKSLLAAMEYYVEQAPLEISETLAAKGG